MEEPKCLTFSFPKGEQINFFYVAQTCMLVHNSLCSKRDK